MKPVIQTDTTFITGNCFSACIASILEVPITDIPNFHIPPEQFAKNLAGWCEDKPFILLDITLENVSLVDDCYVIASGKSPRNKDVDHSVVWFNGEIVHDPHPGNNGLPKSPETFTIFIMKLDKQNDPPQT